MAWHGCDGVGLTFAYVCMNDIMASLSGRAKALTSVIDVHPIRSAESADHRADRAIRFTGSVG